MARTLGEDKLARAERFASAVASAVARYARAR